MTRFDTRLARAIVSRSACRVNLRLFSVIVLVNRPIMESFSSFVNEYWAARFPPDISGVGDTETATNQRCSLSGLASRDGLIRGGKVRR